MARTIPDDRLARLVQCATQVFIAQGYRRTQMADVPKGLGGAKGTLYLYVESKEALFDLVARNADGDLVAHPPTLPIRTPKRGATIKYVRERLPPRPAACGARGARGGSHVTEALAGALGPGRVADPHAELERIVRELYDVVARNRFGIKLLDRAAPDY